MIRVTYPNELSHYGVKGMRWGHRKLEKAAKRISNKRKEKIKAAPAKDAIRTGFKTYASMLATGLLTSTIAGLMIGKARATGSLLSVGQARAVKILSKVGTFTFNNAALIGVSAAVKQSKVNDYILKENQEGGAS